MTGRNDAFRGRSPPPQRAPTLRALALCVVASCVAGWVDAAEPRPVAAADAQPSASSHADPRTDAQNKPEDKPGANAAAETPAQADGNQEDGDDVFTPTESISEDFTVSFPVDI
ncbi:MAG: hypothetical protein ACKOBM_11080 [Gammaproteobacteria bacterium]